MNELTIDDVVEFLRLSNWAVHLNSRQVQPYELLPILERYIKRHHQLLDRLGDKLIEGKL